MDNVIDNMDGNGRASNGKFIPGHKGFKRAGAPEMQRLTREKLWAFLSANIHTLQENYDKLSARDRNKALLMTCEFFLPKQREIFVDATVEQRGASIDYTKLSQPTFDEVLHHTTIHKNEPEI